MKKEYIRRHISAEGVLKESELEKLEKDFIDTYLKTETKPLLMLFRIYRRYWKELLLAIFFNLIKVSPLLLAPITTGAIIDYIVDPTKTYGSLDGKTYVIILVAALVFLLLLNVPMSTLHGRFISIVMRRVEAGLRGAMVLKLQQLSIRFHKEMQSGRIQSKMIRDVETIQGLSHQLFSAVPELVINLLSSIVVVFIKNKLVLLFFILCVPAAVFIMKAFLKHIANSNKSFRVNMESASANIQDMVEMTEITRAHALENKEVEKLNKKLTDVANSGHRVDIINSLFGSSVWVIFQLFQLGCIIFTSFLAHRNFGVAIGDITIYQTYFVGLTSYVSGLINLLPVITKGFDSISSIGEILASEDIEDNDGKTVLPMLRGEYEFKNVSFSYEDDRPLIDGFDLSVKKGETIAFVGESGCGKTTSMNLILGFVYATGGQLLVDGHDIRTVDLHSYRSHIAIVPQNSVLFTGTIRENITYGLTEEISEERLGEAIRAARLTELIDSLPNGIDTMLNEHGSNLSGGQRQRISIARAIIRNPSVIIFDEATSALDNVSEREIQAAIDNLTAEHTTFIVAHRLSTIRNADRIVVMKDGKCVESGSFDELIAKNGVFAAMQKA